MVDVASKFEPLIYPTFKNLLIERIIKNPIDIDLKTLDSKTLEEINQNILQATWFIMYFKKDFDLESKIE